MFNNLRKYAKSSLIKDLIVVLVDLKQYSFSKLSTVDILENYLITQEKMYVSPKVIKKYSFELLDENHIDNHKKFWNVINQLHAWDYILENDYEVNEYFVFNIHAILSRNLNINTFVYRQKEVKFPELNFKPPAVITNEVYEQYLKVLNNQDPIEIALFIMKNQMFENTNKRTGMYVLNAFLLKDNKILKINYDNLEEYLDGITLYYKDGDDSLFRNFVENNMADLDFNLEKVKNLKEKHKKSGRLIR